MAVSFLLALILPKPKQKTQKDPTSPNASAGTSIPRVFGEAVVGGIVIDSTTPELYDNSGKGVLSGGKQQGDTKRGTFQVLIGEGERPWNEFVLIDESSGPQNYVVGNSLTSVVNEVAFLVESGTSNAVRDVHSFSSSYDFVGSLTGITEGLNLFFKSEVFPTPVNGLAAYGYHVIRANEWVIPPSRHQTLTSVYALIDYTWVNQLENITTDRGASLLLVVGVIQDNYLYFPNPGTNGILVSGPTGDIRTLSMGVVSLNRQDLSTTVYAPTSGVPDLSGNGSPLEVVLFGRVADAGIGPPITNRYNTRLSLKNYAVSYTASGGSGGELELLAIYMNDELWYDYEATGPKQREKNTERSQYFAFYDGSLNQSQDPTIVALRGIDKTPGYQGYSHIVYSDIPLDEWGNNYPSSKYKVRSSLPATFGTIIRDIMVRCGILHGKPLLEGKDWADATSSTTGEKLVSNLLYSGVAIDGYVLNTDSTELKNALAQFEQMWRFTLAANANLNSYRNSQAPFTSRLLPLYKTIPFNTGETINVDAEDLGTLDDDTTDLPYALDIETIASDDIPGEVEVQYYNNNKGGEREGVIVDRSTFHVASTHTFTSDYFTNGKKLYTANAIAKFLIEQGVRRAKQITTGVLPNLITGINTSLDWVDKLRIKPQKIMWGDNGNINITGISINIDNPQGEIIDDPIDDLINPEPSLNSSLPLIFWTEGQARLAPATGNRRTVYVWISPSLTATKTEPASILLSTDGASFNQTAINSVERNAQLIRILNISPANFTEFKYANYDPYSVITVETAPGVNLTTSAIEFVIDGTRNIIWSPQWGFVGFVTATLVAANTYELTGILWNIGQSSFDETSPTFTAPSTAWYLIGEPYEILVPTSLSQGSNLTLMAATSTRNAGTYVSTYNAYNSAPRYPVLASVLYEDDSDILISWCPSIDQQTQLVPALFNDPAQSEAENYEVRVYEGSTLKRTTSVSGRVFNYSLSFQTADSIANRAALRYAVIQVGSLGQMQEGTIIDKLGHVI